MSKTVSSPYIEVEGVAQPINGIQVNLCTQLQVPTGERFVVAIVKGEIFFGRESWICDVFEVTDGKFDVNKPLWGFMTPHGDNLTRAQMVYYRMLERLHRKESVEVVMTKHGLDCLDGQIM